MGSRNHKPVGTSRRGFLLGAGSGLIAGSAATYLGMRRLRDLVAWNEATPSFTGRTVEEKKLQFAMPGPFPGRVVEVQHPGSVRLDNTVVATAVKPMIDRGLCELTGADHPVDAWKRLFEPGDVVVIQGQRETLPDTLAQLGLLPLKDRSLALGRMRLRYLPLLILLTVMVTVALGWVSADVAFFGAAVMVVLLKLISPKEAYESIDWPVIVMLGSLIPAACEQGLSVRALASSRRVEGTGAP